MSARSAVAQVLKENLYRRQCYGSVCFVASWIRIVLFTDTDSSINQQKNEGKPSFLLFCDFMNFYL
jgi:hypothetical protein